MSQSDRRFFCSALSLEDDEKIYGTASTGKVWLLLEYAQPWGVKPLRNIQLADTVQRHLQNALNTVPQSRLLLIKQSRALDQPLIFYIAIASEHNPQLYKFRLNSYAELRDIDIPKIVAGESEFAMPHTAERLFLVCTDGKHDKCCAKFGMPLYNVLQRYVGERVWQSSHVGGDRFAGNIVCFPHGLFYGHVTPNAIQPLANDYLENRVRLLNYRGRACYSFPVQAAEFFVRSEAEITDLDDLALIKVASLGSDLWEAQFAARSTAQVHVARLRRYASEFRNFLRCNALEEETASQYELEDYRVAESVTTL